MRKPALAAAMTVLVASLAALVWVAQTKGDVAKPADVPGFAVGTIDAAAQAAGGRRVLAIVAKQGATPVGRIVQSAKSAEGWKPFRATYDPADPLAASLDALAAAAAADFGPDHKFRKETVQALERFEVAVVVATDGGDRALLPDPGETNPSIGLAPEVPALRIHKANPVWLFNAEEPSIAPQDVLGFVRALRSGDAQFRDDEHRMWGGGVTIETDRDAEFLVPWSAAGARVTLDGRPAEWRAARVPVLVVKVPAGHHRLEVEYGESRVARDVVTIAAALGVVASLLAMWIGLRPHPEREEP